MSLREAVAQEAVLKTLLDAIDTEYKAKRAEVQAQLDAARESSGVTRVNAELPDGTVVAKVGVSDPKPEARVVDEKAFLAWVVKNYPDEKATRLVTEVRPAFRDLVLARVTAVGVSQWCDESTGELHDVPGVEVRATRSRSHSVRFESAGREAIAEAWRTGRLGTATPLALLPGEAARESA
jgi:ABC-type uncharacterized transport system YnjBCD ATPase subunit